jgi:hypothetical protein
MNGSVVSVGDYFNHRAGSDLYSWRVTEVLSATLVKLENGYVVRLEPARGAWREVVRSAKNNWVWKSRSKYAYLDRFEYNGATKGPEFLDPGF